MSEWNPTISAQDSARFYSKIRTSTKRHWNGTPCQEWTAYKIKTGYGTFRLKARMLKAHRVAYVLAVGPIPDGMCVCHRCDNPACCNVDHLFLGTHADNMHDMFEKSRRTSARGDQNGARVHPERLRRGEQNGNAKLKDCDIPAVFDLRSQGLSQTAIAIQVGISQSQVSNILRGESRAGAVW